MTASWLELEQPVELIENIFVDAYTAHWRLSNYCRQGFDGVLVVHTEYARTGKLTQTGFGHLDLKKVIMKLPQVMMELSYEIIDASFF